MVNRNLLRDLVSDQDLNDAMQAAFSREDDAESDMDNWLREEKQNIESKFQKTLNQITSVFFSQIEKRKKT